MNSFPIPNFADIPLEAMPEDATTAAQWQAAAESNGASSSELGWETPEGITLPPVLTREALDGLDFLEGYPGVVPFLRGPYPTMYVNQPWTIRQYAGFSTAEESNAFYRRNLASGQKGLSVAWRPTAATTATTHGWRGTSAWQAWLSTPSSTCASSSMGSRSTKCRCR
jgi:methylmalonyl-CoA mutase